MISKKIIGQLEGQELEYILEARMRLQKEVREEVLGRDGYYRGVAENPRVKYVSVEGRRLCCLP